MSEAPNTQPLAERDCPLVIHCELRAEKRGDHEGTTLTGHAAVFNKLSERIFGFRERIDPGAFAESIKKDDIRALVGHDPDKIIGRTSSGTLRLSEDKEGLAVEIDVPDTSVGRDTVVSIERGDLTQMSFAFSTIDDIFETKDGQDIRTLQKVRLFDVSVVAFPAYPQAKVAVRSWIEYRKQKEEDERPKCPPSADGRYLELIERGISVSGSPVATDSAVD